jgi:hypothetical protein
MYGMATAKMLHYFRDLRRGGRFERALKAGLLLWMSVLCPLPSLYSQELEISYGIAQSISGKDSSTWSLDLKYPLTKHVMWSIGYLNELSIRGYHRDGFLTQIWLHTPVWTDKLDIAAGIGPYFSDDTQIEEGESDIEYAPGFITSVDLSYYVHVPWSLRLSYNHVETTSYDSDGLLLGLGLVLPDGKLLSRPAKWPRLKREITPFLIKTFINVNGKPNAWGAALEYRQTLNKHLEWTASGIDEGDSEKIHRRGVATQLWLTDAFFYKRLSLGAGLGPYLHEEESDGSKETHVAALASATVAWRLKEHWTARFNFNRVIGDYHLNADVLMLGVGYQWGGGVD